ncbi:hypothetical protein [Xanthomonas sp. 4461]|uniref:hypothetical protein n=1 Tax=Xanthomonas sp. 4461 TaxID=3035313 RepID=UPI00216A4AA7|nr:hypothetical protein [Xanthomonas sp. 4461]MCS3807766.1 hypothetical protein [Xanthomonas sp. 4461]
MKKIYIFSIAAIIALGFFSLLIFNRGQGHSQLTGKNESVENTERKDDPSNEAAVVARQPSNWASKPSSEIDRDFNELKSRAETGDPIAQRQLAETYERCSIYSVSPENYAKTLDGFAKIKNENKSRYEEIKKRTSHYCSAIDGGNIIPSSASELWYAEAAKNGDLIAQLKTAAHASVPSSAYKGLLEETLKSKDPEAMFAVDEMLANAKGEIDLGNYSPTSGGNYSEYSWALAACEAGADCGPGSYRMDSMCVNFGVCDSANYKDLIRKHFVPPSQLKVIDKDIERIKLLSNNSK